MEIYHGVQIVYEDNHLLVVVKPPNMPTQADASGDPDLHSTMKQYVAEKYQKPGAVYLGLVHRLDRPVGGLVVLARTSKAADRLSEQVRKKTLARQYVAAVRGEAPDSRELNDWLLKDEKTNTVHAVKEGTPGAKDAKLCYALAGRADGLSLLRVKLFTGRSHQIRVQLSHSGNPIWGDARYGAGRPGEQIALWGAHLGLVHPTKKEEMRFDAPPPRSQAPWRLFTEEVWENEAKILL
ncbi:MAG: RluA family pseudouridine synthase [Clostridia bacterium]|nr:RluA family pseudouridine synthase [Clostridia bacterium]